MDIAELVWRILVGVMLPLGDEISDILTAVSHWK